MRYLVPLAFGLALTALAPHAHAADCMPAPMMRAAGAAQGFTPAGALEPADLARAAALYNSTPPASTDVFDAGELMRHADGRGAILFGRGADLCVAFVIPAEHWPQAARLILGDPT